MTHEEFELFPYASDIRMKIEGKTLKELFCNAVRGVAFYLKPEVLKLGKRAWRIKHAIKIEAVDLNSLLIEFLSEVIAESDIQNAIFTGARFKTFGENFLEGEIAGIGADGFDKDIKAVSYHEVDIKKNPETGFYETILVFDI